MSKKREKIYIFAFLLLVSVLLISSCGKQAEEIQYPAAEPPATASPRPVKMQQTEKPEETPEPTESPEPEPEYFTISMIGDCTLASSQHHKGIAESFENTIAGDYSWPFSGTVQYFENDDLTMANLECILSDSDLYGSSTFFFRAPAEYTEILKKGSVELVTVANNHTFDCGQQGLDDTVSALDAAGITSVGENECIIYETESGLKIGIYCAYSGFMPSVQQTVTGIEKLRGQGAELIIAAYHWGNEGYYNVSASQEEVGRAAIDAGADIVYGSHPHVLERVEEYNGGYIYYSLGNWSFGGNTMPRDRDTVIARVTVMRDVDGSISISGTELIPCSLSSTPGINDYRPVPYEPDSEGYARTLSKLDGSYSGPNLTIDYSAFHENEEEGQQDEPPELTTEAGSSSEGVQPGTPASEVPAAEVPVELQSSTGEETA